jgi:hypothetical protein
MSINVKRVLAEADDGKTVWMTPAQADALSALVEIQAGGCGALHGYIPTSGYVEPPVINIQMLTRFSYKKLVERKLSALETINFENVQDAISKTPKLASLSLDEQKEQFNICKDKMLESLNTTLSGDRSDSHRQGHDRCYVRFSSGVKGHLKTEKGEDNLQQPILVNGYPVLESIMLEYLELNRTIVKEGVRKVVNSGPKVLMDNAISTLLNKRSVGFKTASLKEDNFEKLVVSKQEFLPENVSPDILSID